MHLALAAPTSSESTAHHSTAQRNKHKTIQTDKAYLSEALTLMLGRGYSALFRSGFS